MRASIFFYKNRKFYEPKERQIYQACWGGGINGKEICHNVFGEIISLENLFLAWREFSRGKTKKPDVQDFSLNLEDNIFRLHYELKEKIYQHFNYISFSIRDPKLRHIHKACVRDRVLHHAIFRVLYPIFDKGFIFDSYSCRNNKGTHCAVSRSEKFCRKLSKNNHKDIFILKCDIKKFFNSINQRILIDLIKNKIQDSNAIQLIEIIIKSFKNNRDKGLPLGNITSQLFANIYLNELDQFIKHNLRIKFYLRYCDDFIIVSDNAIYLKKLICLINEFLKNKLKLALHFDKILIRRYRQGIDFLGYVVFPYHRILRIKTKRRILKKIREKCQNFRDGLISKISLDQSIQSYFGVLSHCKGYKIKKEILTILNSKFYFLDSKF